MIMNSYAERYMWDQSFMDETDITGRKGMPQNKHLSTQVPLSEFKTKSCSSRVTSLPHSVCCGSGSSPTVVSTGGGGCVINSRNACTRTKANNNCSIADGPFGAFSTKPANSCGINWCAFNEDVLDSNEGLRAIRRPTDSVGGETSNLTSGMPNSCGLETANCIGTACKNDHCRCSGQNRPSAGINGPFNDRQTAKPHSKFDGSDHSSSELTVDCALQSTNEHVNVNCIYSDLLPEKVSVTNDRSSYGNYINNTLEDCSSNKQRHDPLCPMTVQYSNDDAIQANSLLSSSNSQTENAHYVNDDALHENATLLKNDIHQIGNAIQEASIGSDVGSCYGNLPAGCAGDRGSSLALRPVDSELLHSQISPDCERNSEKTSGADRRLNDSITASSNTVPTLSIGTETIRAAEDGKVTENRIQDTSNISLNPFLNPTRSCVEKISDSNSRCGVRLSRSSCSSMTQRTGLPSSTSGTIASSASSGNLQSLASSKPLDSDSANSSDGCYSKVGRFLPEWDAEILDRVYSQLAQSGFYMGKMSLDEANQLICKYSIGTFLLRDSSDSRFVFALTINTCRGPTSIRIVYRAGLFRLDSEDAQIHIMPSFKSVHDLIAHYRRLSCTRYGLGVRGGYVFLESSGRKDTPVLLCRPIEFSPTSLRHQCRRRINGLLAGKSVERLCLSPSLKYYLNEYQFDF